MFRVFGCYLVEDETASGPSVTSFYGLDDEAIFLRADSRYELLFGELTVGRLEDDLLCAGLVAGGDFDVFRQVFGDDTVKLFERPTDVRFAAVSCDARHSDRIGRHFRVFRGSGVAEAEDEDAHHCCK